MSRVIIVLGSPNSDDGQLFAIGIARCEQAFLEFNKYPDAKILCTGGFGQLFNRTNLPHYVYTQRYLQNKGLVVADFLPPALSAYTFEDATSAQPILAKYDTKQATLVTSDFHMARAKLIFSHVMPDINFEYAAAKADLPEAELAKLVAHEHQAIIREKANLTRLYETVQSVK